jgi:hypothetical protein
MAAALYLPPPRRPRLRFTIGGLLACTFIVGVGLAHWRLPGTTTAGTLLASLNAWLVIGQARLLYAALREAGDIRRLPSWSQWAVRLKIGFAAAALLGCLAIIGLGLARPRPLTASLAAELLACFGAWLVIGMLQRTAHGAAHLILWPHGSREARCGLLLGIVTPLGIALLIAVTGAAAVLIDFELPGVWYEGQAASLMTYVAFFLAVVCAYWVAPPPATDISDRYRSQRRFSTGALLAVGFVWGGIALLNIGVLPALVYVAIHGVESYQPTRWMDRDFYPANLESGVPTSFFVGGLAAASLLLAATVAHLFLIQGWSHRRTRYVLSAVSTLCMTAVFGLLLWFFSRLLPDLSPLMAIGVHEQPLSSWPLAAALVIAVATVFANWSAASSLPEDHALADGELPRMQFLHEHPAIIAAGLIGALVAIVSHFSNFHYRWSLPGGGFWRSPVFVVLKDLLVEEPFKLMGVAAAIVLAHRLWAWWRGNTCSTQGIRLVEPARYATAWLAGAIIFALLAPVAAWCGSALLLKFTSA